MSLVSEDIKTRKFHRILSYKQLFHKHSRYTSYWLYKIYFSLKLIWIFPLNFMFAQLIVRIPFYEFMIFFVINFIFNVLFQSASLTQAISMCFTNNFVCTEYLNILVYLYYQKYPLISLPRKQNDYWLVREIISFYEWKKYSTLMLSQRLLVTFPLCAITHTFQKSIVSEL